VSNTLHSESLVTLEYTRIESTADPDMRINGIPSEQSTLCWVTLIVKLTTLKNNLYFTARSPSLQSLGWFQTTKRCELWKTSFKWSCIINAH